MRTSTVLGLVLSLTLAGCGKDTDSSDVPSTGAGTPSGTTTGDFVATAAQSGVVPAVWLVSWTAPGSGSSWVEYGLTETLGETTATDASAAPEIALVGLKPGRTWYWRAVTRLDDGTEVASEISTFDTILPPPQMAPPLPGPPGAGGQVRTGYILFSTIQVDDATSWVMVVDGDGEPVWWRMAAPGSMIVTARPLEDGALMYAEWDLDQKQDTGRVFRMTFDGRTLVETRLPQGSHDYHLWPDGTISYFGYEGDPVSGFAADAIREVPEGATDGTVPTTIWSWLDDYPYAPAQICSHTAAPWSFESSLKEWTHANSLMIDPTGEFFYAMSKFHDSVVKVRRSTGELIWELNGAHSDFTLPGGAPTWNAVGDTELFSHPHMSHLWVPDPGTGYDLCLAVFDNGLHRVPAVSRAVEVCLDETAMTAEVVWSHEDPMATFAANLMGDVRRLDASWLVGWADYGRIEEIGDDHTVLWSLALPQQGPGGEPKATVPGRVSFVSTLYPQP